MKPELTQCIIALVVFSLTIATIAQVVFIELKHAKARYGKAKCVNLIIWMVLFGTLLNIPFVFLALRSLNKL